MKQFEMIELSFFGEILANNYANIDLYGEFERQGKKTKVHGFYDGDGKYLLRFLPKEVGVYRYVVYGLFSQEGEIEVEPNDSCLYIKAVDTHFEDGNGKIYFPFGTTVYGLIHQEESLIEETFETLKNSPFNKIRFCLFPKHYAFNENEPQFYPFKKKDPSKPIKDNHDVYSPDLGYWHHLEKWLSRLGELGIEADIILFHPYDRWGYNELSQKENLSYLNYVCARLSAFPHVWWSLANEYDLCLKRKSVKDFLEIEEYLSSIDPFHHLLSIHNCFHPYDYARPNITHVSIQTKDLSDVHNLLSDFSKPVIVDECCYEGDLPAYWGCISASEMTYRFARCLSSGAYCSHGETYLDEHDVLWWAKGGKLKGDSPARIAFLRSLLEEIGKPLLPIPSSLASFGNMSEQEKEVALKSIPAEFRHYPKGIFLMDKMEARRFFDSEYEYHSHTKDDSAFFMFLDRRTCRYLDIDLPEGKTYQVELLDVYNMSRTTLLEKASGHTRVSFSPKEGLAILAKQIY